MREYKLSNGHSVKIEKANRGIADDYKIIFCEDGRKLFEEYGNRDYIEWQYEIEIA